MNSYDILDLPDVEAKELLEIYPKVSQEDQWDIEQELLNRDSFDFE